MSLAAMLPDLVLLAETAADQSTPWIAGGGAAAIAGTLWGVARKLGGAADAYTESVKAESDHRLAEVQHWGREEQTLEQLCAMMARDTAATIEVPRHDSGPVPLSRR